MQFWNIFYQLSENNPKIAGTDLMKPCQYEYCLN